MTPIPIHFRLAKPTMLLNVWQRMHWTKRREFQQALSWDVRVAIGGARHHPIERCVISIERRSIQLPDWDGLYGGAKSLLDCLVVPSKKHPAGLGVIRDDDPGCILRLIAEPVRVSRKIEEGTAVSIIPITSPEGEKWVRSLSWQSIAASAPGLAT